MIEKLNEIFVSLKENLLALLPNIIMALIVVAIGYFLARLVKKLIIKLVMHISDMADQRFFNINMNRTAKVIGAVFFWAILIISFVLAIDLLNLSFVTSWVERILNYAPNVFAAILIISVAVIIGKYISGAISSFGQGVGLDHANTLGKLAQYLILLVAIVVAIDQIGFEISFLIDIIIIILAALLFAAALAFGLGAKTSVGNILAAFYVRKQYKAGDLIKIGDIEGKIIKIDVNVVVVDTDTGKVSIPAKEFNENVSSLIKKK